MRTLMIVLLLACLAVAGCAVQGNDGQEERVLVALKALYADPDVAYALDEVRLQMRYSGKTYDDIVRERNERR